MTTCIDVQTHDAHLTITFNRPQKRNALDLQMYIDLKTALQQAEYTPAIHSVILQGSPECFTAGNDLSDFLQQGGPIDIHHPICQFLLAYTRFPKPLIVGACGPAIGVGATLLLHSDVVILGEDTQIQMPFIQLGLVPEFASSLLLPLRCGHLRASELLLLGKKIDAQQALAWGLATEIQSNEMVSVQCQMQAQQFALLPLESILATKKLLRAPLLQEIKKQINLELEDFTKQLKNKATQERIRAVLKAS